MTTDTGSPAAGPIDDRSTDALPSAAGPARFLLDRLRRTPDVEAANLVAVDATDRLLLDTAADALGVAAPGEVVVIGDRYGALTLGAVTLGAPDVRTHQDDLIGELALAGNADRLELRDRYRSVALTVDALRGAHTVLVQAPKSLAELEEIAQVLAAAAVADATVLVGGRVKHMTSAMNDVLRRSFTDVHATLARQKSRLLVATGPLPGALTFPVRRRDSELDLEICAHGGVFAGTKLDVGTRFLLSFLDRMPATVTTAVDLGCGTGILAAQLRRRHPDAAVIAIDQSAAAVRSAIATAAANELPIDVRRDYDLSTVPAGSADLIVCNPPFHLGTAVGASFAISPAHAMFAAAGRTLRPGGQLWTVFNSSLDYAGSLTRCVGPTRIAGRNPKFTVTVSTRR